MFVTISSSIFRSGSFVREDLVSSSPSNRIERFECNELLLFDEAVDLALDELFEKLLELFDFEVLARLAHLLSFKSALVGGLVISIEPRNDSNMSLLSSSVSWLSKFSFS